MINLAVLGEVGAESGALGMPDVAEIVAGAWVEVTEELGTNVIIAVVIKAAAFKSLLFFEYLVFAFLIHNICQHTVLTCIACIFIQEGGDSARSQVYHVADVFT